MVESYNSLHELKALINTSTVSATKAAFLAGFAYYQIGRYNYTESADDSYIVFNTCAFVFSVLAATINALIGYYCPKAILYDNDTRTSFVNSIKPFSRVCFQFYQLALIVYTLGLSRMGFVYYSDSNAKYIPFVLFIISSIFIIVIIYGCIIRKYLQLEEKILGEAEVNLRISAILNEYRGTTDKADKPIEDKLKLQCDIIASRAIYIAGIAQNGVLRYLPYGSYSNSSYSNIGIAFLFFSCIATATALLSSSFLSVVSIFINDAPDYKKRAISILFEKSIANISFALYAFSFIFIAIMIILMPYGCHYPTQAIYNIINGSVSLISIIVCMYFTYSAYQYSKDDEYSNKDDKTCQKEKLDRKKAISQRILSQINNTGSQATLSSAFIFYNVLTQYSILETNNGITSELWIFINVLTVSTGLLSAIFDSIISFGSTTITSHHGRFLYLLRTRIIQRSCSVLFYVSLAGWFILFGLLGFTKFSQNSYIPLTFAVVFGLLTMAGAIYLESVYSVVSIELEFRTSISLTSLEQTCQHNNEKASRLNNIAFKVLFLGGFAYNAAINFQFQGIVFDQFYLTFMSACFCTSLTIVSWAAFYNIKMFDCLSDENVQVLQYEFSHATHLFYECSCLLAAMVLILLLFGFSLIGLIKNRSVYTNWFQIFPIMIATAVKTLVFGCFSFSKVRKYYLRSLQVNDDQILKDEYTNNHILDQIEVAASASSFVAGNVLYEILFTETLANSLFLNYFYMICNNSTFFAGVITVLYSIQANYFLGELNSETKKMYFKSLLRNDKPKYFWLSCSLFFTWLLAIIVLGKVKYNSIHAAQSNITMVLGFLGTVLFLYFTFYIKTISNKYIAKMQRQESRSSIFSSEVVMNNIHERSSNRIHDNT